MKYLRTAKAITLCACAAAFSLPPAYADQQRAELEYFLFIFPIYPFSASARLNFSITVDKMLFFRVGNGAGFGGNESGVGPAADSSISSVAFTSTASIPSAATVPIAGNNVAVQWSGAAPSFAASAPVVLPVEVRSNAGQVSITAQATTALTSGSNTLPMNAIGISSSSAQLPAPSVPASGVSSPVLVTVGGTGTSAAPSLLTYRTANWSFAYTPQAATAAGSYSGQITFTASAP